MCFDFLSCLTPQEGVVKVSSFREVGNGVSEGKFVDCASVSVSLSDSVSFSDSVCFSARVFDLTASPDSEREIGAADPFHSRKSAVPVEPCCVNIPRKQNLVWKRRQPSRRPRGRQRRQCLSVS